MLPKKYKNVKRSLKVCKTHSGLGVVTLEPIEKNGFIIEYVGPILTKEQADKRGGKYLFETNKNRFIDGTDRSNTARYLNHSCKPNCEIDIKGGHVIILAKRGIKAGEELEYDYGKEYFDEFISRHGCRCGAKKHLY
jgi:SET domain-containing protein